MSEVGGIEAEAWCLVAAAEAVGAGELLFSWRGSAGSSSRSGSGSGSVSESAPALVSAAVAAAASEGSSSDSAPDLSPASGAGVDEGWGVAAAVEGVGDWVPDRSSRPFELLSPAAPPFFRFRTIRLPPFLRGHVVDALPSCPEEPSRAPDAPPPP